MGRKRLNIPDATTYVKQKETRRERQAEISRGGRDIGQIRPIADVERRLACRDDPELFCKTYDAEAYPLAFCKDHRDMIQRIKEAATLGALYAIAMDRGKGKTTLCRSLARWAISYGIVRYVFLIGATHEKAKQNLEGIKSAMRFSPLYAADFPEICQPVQQLANLAQKAAGQLCLGHETLIGWGKDFVFLPTVPPPENWPKDWPLRSDGMVPTSGSVIGTSGLTGDGIRGSLITLATGENLRPDLVLLDDPQTPESAHSPSQNATRIQLVSADILGLAGPGKQLSAVMPCTVIVPGDMADTMLDRQKNPLWRGDRRRLLNSMPRNMGAWDLYFEVYREDALREPPNFERSNAYYLEHRGELDEGAEASWAERKLPEEVSAIQHAMHLFFRHGAQAFASEFQNQPLSIFDPADHLPKLNADTICGRLNRHARQVVPSWATTLTASIDVHQKLLFYAVCAWGPDFGGSVVDYGAWPGQSRLYYSLRDANPTIETATGISSVEGSIYASLTKLTESLLSAEWHQEAGAPMRVSRCLVDSGWKSEAIYRFCRESLHGAIITPSKGIPISAEKSPIPEWPQKAGERRGLNWLIRGAERRVRLLMFDTNFWKTHLAERLLMPMGDRSALTLYGDKPGLHRLLADHMIAEYRIRKEGRGRRVDQWMMKPGDPDNHLFDVLVMNCVAASMCGIQLAQDRHSPRMPSSEVRRKQLEKLREKQRKAL